MFEELYKALPPYGQIILTIFIAAGGGLAAWQGLKRANTAKLTGSSTTTDLPASGPMPLWAMMGPVHEVMQTIHDMAEDQRSGNAALMDACKQLNEVNRGQEYTHDLLEAILRNQEMQGGQPPTPRRQRRPTA